LQTDGFCGYCMVFSEIEFGKTVKEGMEST